MKYQSKIVITFLLITAQYINGSRNWIGRTLDPHPLLLVHAVSYNIHTFIFSVFCRLTQLIQFSFTPFLENKNVILVNLQYNINEYVPLMWQLFTNAHNGQGEIFLVGIFHSRSGRPQRFHNSRLLKVNHITFRHAYALLLV